MSSPIQKACFIAGTPRSSGDVQTGELQFVRGGGRAFSNFSGAPATADQLVFSGAGRLNSIVQHTQMISGLSAVFYDAAVATSGGPFAASGHKILAILPPTWGGGTQGSGVPNIFNGLPMNIDMPFQSGLCFNTRSGVPGFTVSYTPESNVLNGGTVTG